MYPAPAGEVLEGDGLRSSAGGGGALKTGCSAKPARLDFREWLRDWLGEYDGWAALFRREWRGDIDDVDALLE